MRPDVLREATRALREAADESTARPEETRARVMRTLQVRRARRLAAIRVLLPLAAVLLGSVAWASATHRLPARWYELAEQLGLTARNEPAEPPALAPAPREAPPALAAPTLSGVDPAAAEVIAAAPKAAPPSPAEPRGAPALRKKEEPRAQHASSTTPSAAPAGAAPATTAQASSEAAAPAPFDAAAHALYEAAHRAHFVDRNPRAALSAWNAYLAAAPRGRFAVEAHYNRALCLVRLGRTAEARKALEPFASGRSGGYRRAEAQKLLDAMSGGGP